MNRTHTLVAGLLTGAVLSTAAVSGLPSANIERNDMELGNFSVSLAVKDLQASHAFYQKLGFQQIGGDAEQNWLILRNGDARIGLFQGMFADNILTFNPGWDAERNTPDSFDDVRAIQAQLQADGIEMLVAADPESTGPAHLVIQDPDGNQIMLDQHVAKP